MFARYTNLHCKPIYAAAQATFQAQVDGLLLTHVGEHLYCPATPSFHSHPFPILRALFTLVPPWKQSRSGYTMGLNGESPPDAYAFSACLCSQWTAQKARILSDAVQWF
jgi:hypothetical protein